jgi:nucleotidyltransferase/DNA polymerase involved in DNA repair
MTILCAIAPNFLYALEARAHDDWRDKPIALIGPDGRVWAASPLADTSGVEAGLSPRQARSRCPDALLRPLDAAQAEAAQAAFIGVLTATGMPVEPQGYGAAYCDLSPVATSPRDARAICADLGARIRRDLGDALTPALGVDHGKFTARAAAQTAKPGSMRLVEREDEARFLTPQPVSLLPLPPDHLRQLRWLGLRTLGEFAQLPVASVVARFGKAGALAHGWARGRDDRPVRALAQQTPQPVALDFETPCAAVDLALADAARAVQPSARALSERLEGCRRIRVELRFLNGVIVDVSQALAQPACHIDDLRVVLKRILGGALWPAELVGLRIWLLEIAELTPAVLTLFGDQLDAAPGSDDASPFAPVARKLGARHPGALYQAVISDAAHPIAERRVTWVGVGGQL